MEKIEIYTSKKKSFLLLIGSLLFVLGGIYMSLHPENFHSRNPIFVRGVGIVSVLFFGLGIYVSLKQLIKNQLILVIDKIGINVNPKKSESIEWKNINGFSEIQIQSTRIVIVNIDNSDFWIEKEKSMIRKKLMKYNVNNYGSPFNFAANSMQINHDDLLKILNANLSKYKYNA